VHTPECLCDVLQAGGGSLSTADHRIWWSSTPFSKVTASPARDSARDARHTPASCVHNPRVGVPNLACEGCRVYPLSPNLPDPKVRGIACPDD
jgi:hypothetical protein